MQRAGNCAHGRAGPPRQQDGADEAEFQGDLQEAVVRVQEQDVRYARLADETRAVEAMADPRRPRDQHRHAMPNLHADAPVIVHMCGEPILQTVHPGNRGERAPQQRDKANSDDDKDKAMAADRSS